MKYKDSSWATMLENRLRLAKDWLNEKGSIFVRCDYNGNWIVRCLMDEIFGKENFRNEVGVRRFKKNVMEKEIKKLPEGLDTIYVYSKSEPFSYTNPFKTKEEKRIGFWRHMGDSSGQGTPKIFFGKEIAPSVGKHWKYSQEKIDEMINKGKLILECRNCGYIHDKLKGLWRGCPKCGEDNSQPKYWVEEKEIEVLDSNWSDLYGYSTTWNFSTENSEILLKRVIESTSNGYDLVMDYFLGSGTTTAVAHKLGRKWLGVEMGEHFYTVILPRMKKVLAYDKSGISKEKDVKEKYNQNNAGGFFKYYELEQYEEALDNCKYENDDLFNSPLIKGWQSEGLTGYWSGRSPYQEYVFLKDEKMLKAMEIDYENDKVNVDLSQIYPNIDIAETLSNLTGKWIKKITPCLPEAESPLQEENNTPSANAGTPLQEGNYEVEFEDGTKINTKDLDYKLIKPLIWWE
ncbi:MAG: site-specific DNA-methyltransferase [Bacteroidales bacterium]|nr:site-specific DNA-methyltransferase [Bacteroidales bacterium]